jgi:hypothetical protein
MEQAQIFQPCFGAAWRYFAFRLPHRMLYVASAMALWFMVARMALGITGLLP